MNRFNLFFLPDGRAGATGGGTPVETGGGVTSSLADLIVGFDISPYLNESPREVWNILQALEADRDRFHHFQPRTIPIGIAYSSDIDKVIQTLEGIAADNEMVVGESSARVRIRGFADKAINFELLCWMKRPADRGLAVHELNYQLIRRFREDQIEIPFPQRDMRVRDLPFEPKTTGP
jgi:hypothetical protein